VVLEGPYRFSRTSVRSVVTVPYPLEWRSQAVEVIATTIPALAVASIYCLYSVQRRDQERRQRREQRLRERVAFMLWMAAHEMPDDEE
jgi:hypothetical protein